MSNEEAIRIGVIGAGTNTKLKHIPGFQSIDGVTVDEVEDTSAKIAFCLARRPAMNSCPSWSSAVSATAIGFRFRGDSVEQPGAASNIGGPRGAASSFDPIAPQSG